MTVKLPVDMLSTQISPISIINRVTDPCGVAVNRRGGLVVTEVGQHCVSVFSSSREKIRSFGFCGSGHGDFKCPRGVAVDGEGNIFVADCSNHRIQKFMNLCNSSILTTLHSTLATTCLCGRYR